jgi:citrate lyase subunit beta/citryl-CoA lyase
VQIPVVRDAFRPPADRVVWAAHVLAAAHDGAAVAIDGSMVDEAVLRTARRILALADTSD